jgi:hypothetical protein
MMHVDAISTSLMSYNAPKSHSKWKDCTRYVLFPCHSLSIHLLFSVPGNPATPDIEAARGFKRLMLLSSGPWSSELSGATDDLERFAGYHVQNTIQTATQSRRRRIKCLTFQTTTALSILYMLSFFFLLCAAPCFNFDRPISILSTCLATTQHALSWVEVRCEPLFSFSSSFRCTGIEFLISSRYLQICARSPSRPFRRSTQLEQ